MAENKITVQVTVNGEDYSGGNTGGECACEGHKVIDNLDSNDAEACLSAKQGRALKDEITNQARALKDAIDDQGRTLNERIDNINVSGGTGGSSSTEIVDNLNSSSITAALSANQGRILNNKINNLNLSGGLGNAVTSKVTTYQTVAEMKNSSDVREGMLVVTMGYFVVNDGGGALYYVRSKTSADSSDNVFIQMQGDLVFEMLIEDNTVNLAQLGFFTSVSVEARTNILKQAIMKFKSGGKILLPVGDYGLDPIQIDEYIAKLTIMGVSSGSTSLNVRANSANNNKYLFNFNRGMREMRFEGFQISGADNCNGFLVKQYDPSNAAAKRNVYIDFKDVYMWKVHKGVDIENGVYVVFDDVKVHLTGGCVSGEDFGIRMTGYEYNYLRDCSFQTNSSGTYKEVDLLIIKGAEHVWIDACEFAKTNGACIKLTTKDSDQRVGYIKITHCKFQKVGRGLCCELGKSKGIGDIILDDIDYIAAHSNNNGGNLHPAISAYRAYPVNDGTTAERDVYKLHVRNFFFGREGTYSTGEIIKFEEYPQSATPLLMREIGMENVINGGNNDNALICIPNGAKLMYFKLSDCNGRTTTMTQRSENNKEFTITTKSNTIISSNILPSIGLAFEGLEGYYFTQSTAVKNTSNKTYSVRVKFETAPPVGTYNVYYSINF